MSSAEGSLQAELNMPQEYSDLATRIHLWANTSLLSSPLIMLWYFLTMLVLAWYLASSSSFSAWCRR